MEKQGQKQLKSSIIEEKYVLLLWLNDESCHVIGNGFKSEIEDKRKKLCNLLNKHKFVDFTELEEIIPEWRIVSIRSIKEVDLQAQLEAIRKYKEEQAILAQEEQAKVGFYANSQQELLDTPFDIGGAKFNLDKMTKR